MDKRPAPHQILNEPLKGDASKRPKPTAVQSYGVIPLDELKSIAKKTGKVRTQGFKPEGIAYTKVPKTTKPEEYLKPGLLLPKDGVSGSGVDRAVVPDPTDYPWRCIGKVFVGWNNDFNTVMWTGSGCLVGPNLMLTASHVAPWDKDGGWMLFVPAYTDGSEPFGSSYVLNWYGIQNFDTVEGHDYVICNLQTPLGNQCGWFGSYWWGDAADYENKTWTSVGYPGNVDNAGEEVVENGVDITNVVFDSDGGAELLTNNDFYTSPGWSGGPLFGYLPGDEFPVVVGVMSGWESFTSGELDDVNAGGNYMVDVIVYGEQTWPM
jgi:V8-like Glu-specific endopeptidase